MISQPVKKSPAYERGFCCLGLQLVNIYHSGADITDQRGCILQF